MSNLAIRVENLSKMYRIGGPQESYQTFRDAIARMAAAPFKKARDLLRGQAYGAAGLTEEIWALKDICFEVKHGEVIGIIGRNGAGKSTLLKILSRITEPTSGYVDVYGRVGALLEVGTGFHEELTGRENIYLNGAILGMNRTEINRKFDEIVDFAGVEKFVDTPVKHYSSGMRLRLGFAVAAHLDSEILIVDEVLAVGDAEFQKKCLGKMGYEAKRGRTVLFVSHNMGIIRHLCPRTILLNHGQVIMDSNTDMVVTTYLERDETAQDNYADLRQHPNREEGAQCIMTDVWIEQYHDDPLATQQFEGVKITVRLEPQKILDNPTLAINVEDSNHTVIFTIGNYFTDNTVSSINRPVLWTYIIPRLPLLPGRYYLTLAAGIVQDRRRDIIFRAVSFEVYHRGDAMDARMAPRWHGSVRVKCRWDISVEGVTEKESLQDGC